MPIDITKDSLLDGVQEIIDFLLRQVFVLALEYQIAVDRFVVEVTDNLAIFRGRAAIFAVADFAFSGKSAYDESTFLALAGVDIM